MFYCLFLHVDVLHGIFYLEPLSLPSTSVNNSNSTSVLFKHACHVNPGADKKSAGSSSYTSIHMFLKFQIHLQAIMYHSGHTNHDNHLDFYY